MIGRTGLRVLFRTVRPRKHDLARLAAWSVVEGAPAYVTGRAVAGATDAFLAARPGAGLAWLAALVAAAVAGAAGTRLVYGPLAAIVEPFRDDLVTRVVRGALHDTGADATRAVSRLTHQVEIVRDTFAGMIMVTRTFAVTVIAAVAGLASLDGVLTLFVVPPLVIGLAVFSAIVAPQARRLRAYVLAEERVSRTVTATAAGLRDVVACGARTRAAHDAGADIDDQARAAIGVARFGAARMLCLALGGWLPVALLITGSPWLLARGVTTGAILGALTYVIQAVLPALQTLTQGIGSSGLRLVVTLDRIIESTPDPPALNAERAPEREADATRRETSTPERGADAPGRQSRVTGQEADAPGREAGPDSGAPEQTARPAGRETRPAGREARPGSRVAGRGAPVTGPGANTPGKGPRSAPRGAYTLRGVTFAYGPQAVPILDGLTLDVPAGDHLAVVGPSGIGKSTLAGILSGLLRPDAGDVLLDGRALPGDAAWRVFLPQEAYVFAGTVRENLTYYGGDGHLDAAVDLLGARDLVGRLGGPDTDLDPSRLSGGERQLVAAVRAYLSPAPVAILDEATSELPASAEARVEQAFAARGGTLIVVAHRLTSAERARHVLVMDGSRAVEGTHAVLADTDPAYRELVGAWSP